MSILAAWIRLASFTLFIVIGIAVGITLAKASESSFQFALLGDRTGEAQPGVYEEAWQEATAQNPAFVLTVGDTIQGGHDETVGYEWQHVMEILAPYSKFKLFLTPGNHDVWSPASERAFERFAQHPVHYSFDWQQAHFTVLNDSGSDNFSEDELAFLQSDLAAHATQPVKFIVSHRPAWLFSVVLRSTSFPFHQLAKRYGVQNVISGHIHQMIHVDLDGVRYLSMASSGGHLRNDKSYEHGWFFQHTTVTVSGTVVRMEIQELKAPFGKGRVSSPEDWGSAGLLSTLGGLQ